MVFVVQCLTLAKHMADFHQYGCVAATGKKLAKVPSFL
jgi:hypothetical protein